MGLHTTLEDVHIREIRQRRSLRVDHEKLAWAAGFFDGEGSTFAKADNDRPGYHQLVVAVPQAGTSTPRVLERFREAMLGMGRIDPPSKAGTYLWRSRGFVDAQQTVILLWPYLGEVKRRQAAAAMRRVSGQFTSGIYRPRPPKSSPVLVDHRLSRRSEPSRLDRAWAAGFIDGEGCFGLVRAQSRVGGQPWYRIRASSTQHGQVGVPAEVLHQLHRIVGVGHIECHGEPDDFKWVVEGIPAIEHVLEVVGPWLGAVKREQAREAMAAFMRQVRLKGGTTYCLDRRKRAALGIPPRAFKDVARRYTE